MAYNDHLHPENAAWPNLDRVIGSYLGKPFSGTVINDRANGMNWTARQITVLLDDTVSEHHQAGETLLVTVCGACGQALAGFGHMSVEPSFSDA